MPRLPRRDSIEKSREGIIRFPTRGISSTKLVEDINIFRLSTGNVASPPTAVEITAALGTASRLPDGVAGIIDDSGLGVSVWLCVVKGDSWWYEQLTKAV